MSERFRYKHDKKPGIGFPAPAPGALEIVQAFVNTIPHGEKADGLATPRDLVRWFSDRALLNAGTRVTEKDRKRAVRFRDGLHALVSANSGAEVDPEVVRSLDLETGGVRFQVRFDESGPVAFESCAEGLDNALGALLQVVIGARQDGSWSSLKVCARKSCRRVFFDSSRRQIGRWCTRRCGSAEWGGPSARPARPIPRTDCVITSIRHGVLVGGRVGRYGPESSS